MDKRIRSRRKLTPAELRAYRRLALAAKQLRRAQEAAQRRPAVRKGGRADG